MEKENFRIGDMVSFLNEHEGLVFGEITSIDESTPLNPLVIEFDDGQTRHFTLDGKYHGKKIKLIHRKK